MELMRAIESSRDTRHFMDNSVPKADLDRALMAVLHSPTVGLSQPCRILDIRRSPRATLIKTFTAQQDEAEAALRRDK